MKYAAFIGLVCLGAWGQVRPTIGVIETYGNRSFSAARLQKELKIQVGDPLPPSKGDLEALLVGLKGIVRANVEAVCCEGGKAIFYVGVEERGKAHLELREEPRGEGLELPGAVRALHEQIVLAAAEAVREGKVAEDWRQGFALSEVDGLRKLQEQLPALVEEHQAILRRILRESADPDDRRVAAAVLGYGPKAQSMIDDLQLALRDPDGEVRAAALRSLGPLATYAEAHPEAEVRVLSTWFVEMLNSVAWKDRMNAMNLLVTVTAKREEKLMRHMRERAVPALAEMALWQHLPHALPAYILLGRVAGLSEAEIESTWSGNQREETVRKMRKKLKA